MGLKRRKTNIFREKIQTIFIGIPLYNYLEVPHESYIEFKLENRDWATNETVTYNNLSELSSLLGTTEIGFRGDFEYGYYEEITKSVFIYCNNVVFPE